MLTSTYPSSPQADRPNGGMRLQTAAFEAINELVRQATNDTLPLVVQLVPVFIQRLSSTLQTQPAGADASVRQSEVQACTYLRDVPAVFIICDASLLALRDSLMPPVGTGPTRHAGQSPGKCAGPLLRRAPGHSAEAERAGELQGRHFAVRRSDHGSPPAGYSYSRLCLCGMPWEALPAL